MNPFSLDLRQRIVAAYEAGEGSIRAVADQFAVSARTVERYLRRWRTAGTLRPRARRNGPRRRLRAHELRVVMQLLREKNDRTDAEFAAALAVRTGVRISARTMNRTWRRLDVTRKKSRFTPRSGTGLPTDGGVLDFVTVPGGSRHAG
jgi:transposase